MKNIKKLSLITLLSAGAIFTVACSQGGGNNQSAETTTTQTTQAKPVVKLTKEDALTKTIEFFNKVESYKLVRTVSGTVKHPNLPPQNGKLEESSEFNLIKNPLQAYIVENSNQRGNAKGYIKDNTLYNFAEKENKWTKSPIQDTSGVGSGNLSMIQEIAAYNKDFTFAEEGDFYKVTFKPTNLDDWNNHTKKMNANYISTEAPSAVITIDKYTGLPHKVEAKVNYNEGNFNFDTTVNLEYKDYNSVKPFELPEEAKNATAQ